jgi:uncharacterized protein YjdB
MADTRVLSNRRVGFWGGPDNAIADWDAATLAELQALTNVSEASKIDGTDFNVDASEQGDDRSFTDEAGAQSRTYDSFGGNMEFFTPRPEDATSILRDAKDIYGTPRTRLVHVMRQVKLNTQPIAAGDEVSIFRVITDARAHHRSEASYSYGVGLNPRDNCLLNYIVPSAVPTSVVATPATDTIAVGETSRLKVAYEGRNITIGAIYSSSDPDVAEVTKHGIVIGKATGSATISVDYPGAGTPDTVAITVS